MTNASRESRAEHAGARRDLLVGGDDPVHVARQPARRAGDHVGSRWSENAAAARAHWSFRCAVGATTISRPPAARQLVARGGQRERRLAGAGRRDREEVGRRGLDEAVERVSSARGGGGRCGSSGRRTLAIGPADAPERPAPALRL